jgi:hypothetical protein
MTAGDKLPADPGARRIALIVWLVAATLGTVAIWWLSTYIQSLTELGRTNREAAAALFKTRVLPALWVVALVSLGAGGVLARHGIQALRTGAFPPEGARLIRDTPRQSGGAVRMIGILLTTAGILIALLPLGMVLLVMWALR